MVELGAEVRVVDELLESRRVTAGAMSLRRPALCFGLAGVVAVEAGGAADGAADTLTSTARAMTWILAALDATGCTGLGMERPARAPRWCV